MQPERARCHGGRTSNAPRPAQAPRHRLFFDGVTFGLIRGFRGPETQDQLRRRHMNLDAIETAVREAVTMESPTRADALEALVAALLASTGAFSPHATDGLVPLREEVGVGSYFTSVGST